MNNVKTSINSGIYSNMDEVKIVQSHSWQRILFLSPIQKNSHVFEDEFCKGCWRELQQRCIIETQATCAPPPVWQVYYRRITSCKNWNQLIRNVMIVIAIIFLWAATLDKGKWQLGPGEQRHLWGPQSTCEAPLGQITFHLGEMNT